ncbi:MAG: hypothetical protein KDB37_18850, partial [Ilumatobacter sp.]|nr:hypothetical protein [Ilumatobacter sp.]
MSEVHPPDRRHGADSICHPHFLQAMVAQRMTGTRVDRAVLDDAGERLRERLAHARPTVGPQHVGAKGRVVHRLKAAMQRTLYWYVEPSVDILRSANLELIDMVEALGDEVSRLHDEVASLERDLDHELDAARVDRR